MHWGLTTFEKKRIEKIALDHPYFDTHAPLLTKREIASIVKEGSHKNGYQVIAEVMAELGITYVPAKHKKRSFGEALRDMSFVPSFRRSVALGLLCLLLVLFMTFTAPGRAFAEEVYSIIINFVEDALKASNNIPFQNHDAPDFTIIPEDLDALEDLSRYIDYPLFISNDSLTAFDYYVMTQEELIVISQYETTDRKPYVIYQQFKGPNVSWGISIEMQDNPIKIDLSSELNMFLGHSSDGDVQAIGFADSFSLRVASPVLTDDELMAVLQRVYKIE